MCSRILISILSICISVLILIQGIHIKPNNIAYLLSEEGSVADLECSEPVGLQICGFPDLMHLPTRYAGMLSHEADAPMCGHFRNYMNSVIQNLLNGFAIQFPWLAGSQRIMASLKPPPSLWRLRHLRTV